MARIEKAASPYTYPYLSSNDYGQRLIYTCSIQAQWNIDKYLHRFVSDPKKFRSQLGAYDALVSGSLALQFFERVVWPDSDLDVFINVKNVEAFSRYLVTEEGYTEPIETKPRQENYRHALDISSVR